MRRLLPVPNISHKVCDAYIHVQILLHSRPFLFSEQSARRQIFIGPESDHWLCLSLTHSLTHLLPNSLTNSCLVNLIDVTLACEDAYSKLVEVVTLADVSDEDRVADLEAEVWS